MVAVLALTADARSVRERPEQVEPVERAEQHSFVNSQETASDDETLLKSSDYANGQTSLGSFQENGTYPGYILGWTYQDFNDYPSSGRTVNGRSTPHVHFVYHRQFPEPGPSSYDWIVYLNFNPLVSPNGVFLSDQWLQSNPLWRSGGYATLDVDTAGRAIVACQEWDHDEPYVPYTVRGYWDDSGPGSASFVHSELDSLISLGHPNNDGLHMTHPRIAYQAVYGIEATHILCEEAPDSTLAYNLVTHWRKTGHGPAGPWTTTCVVIDSLIAGSHQITASDIDQEVVISWAQGTSLTPDIGGQIRCRYSINGGLSWSPKLILADVSSTNESLTAPPVTSSLTDSQERFHKTFVTWKRKQSFPLIYTLTIRHWGGDPAWIEFGIESIVYRKDFLWSKNRRIQNLKISECNGRLYVTWDERSLLPLSPSVQKLSVSKSLEGKSWDAARETAKADKHLVLGTAADTAEHMSHTSVSPYGMNVAEFWPTYWGAAQGEDDVSNNAFAVRDYLEPAYPDDSFYLDVLYADVLASDSVTLNPIKWFRLPCVEPVLAPRIWIEQGDWHYPTHWVKSGHEVDLDVMVENIGNDTLHVTDVLAVNQDPAVPDWLGIFPTTLIIGPADSGIVAVHVNDGGVINPAPGTAVAISADIVFTSDDPDNPTYSFEINTIVADTVVEPSWDTVATGMGMALTVCNQGGAGNVGIGGANMDFVGPDSARIQPPYADCDTTQVVYLYDLCPIVMKSVSDYSWGPFWTPDRAASHNFQPIPSTAPKLVEGANFDRYSSGTFVNHDTTIYMVKHWIAPADAVPYMIERIDMWSETSVQTGVRVGEWIDWDLPSDTASNNEGGIGGSGDYLWQRGLTYGELDPVPCVANENRYGGSGLLGWYYDSEYALDTTVNHTTGLSGLVALDDDLFAGDAYDTLVPDSVWSILNSGELRANNSEADDQHILLGFGNFQIRIDDTLHICVLHMSEYDGGLKDANALSETMNSAKVWYMANRSSFVPYGCCGEYTGGYTGNTNCDTDGKRNLADITRLIDRVYVSQASLCCEPNGNTNGDPGGLINLADITRLIDYVYVSHAETAPCT
jgi:hypothetical protein